MKQQAKEIKVFNAVTLEVLSQANIKTSVFNKSVELYMITEQDNLLQAAKLSLFTPFKLNEGVTLRVLMPNGEVFRTTSSDSVPPMAPKKEDCWDFPWVPDDGE